MALPTDPTMIVRAVASLADFQWRETQKFLAGDDEFHRTLTRLQQSLQKAEDAAFMFGAAVAERPRCRRAMNLD